MHFSLIAPGLTSANRAVGGTPPMNNERAPKPSRSESEERRRLCALMYDFET